MSENLFLITNDDGFRAEGLEVLSGLLKPLGRVVIAAPDIEQSACSHAITLARPLRTNQFAPDCWSVDGTTTDCVLLASQKLLPHLPDAVFSGINHGSNLGDDVTYSGTVAGAFEGCLLGVRSLALSAGDQERLKDPACLELLGKLIGNLLRMDWPKDVLLNVNLPPSGVELRGIRLTRLGRRHYAESVIEKTDPRGKVYYWIGGVDPRWYGDADSDFQATAEGFISVTPLHLDLTHYPSLELFRRFESKI